MQIDFLNSVIVDMQRKNEELNIRLQAMEAGEMRNGTPHEDDYIRWVNLRQIYFLILFSSCIIKSEFAYIFF